jgi:LacI family kdg operon repressor
MVLIDRKIPDFACDVVGLDNTQAATTATEHLIEQGFEALLFLSEPLGTVNTRRERLDAFRATLARYPGVVAENAETPLHEAARSITPCASSTPAIAGCAKPLSPPTAH